MTMLEIIAQIAIAFFSGASVWAFAGRRHRLACILGLCGQPFWFYSTWTGGLWGMFAVSLWFSGNYVRGLLDNPKFKIQNSKLPHPVNTISSQTKPPTPHIL